MMKKILLGVIGILAVALVIFLVLFALLPLPGRIPVLMYHFVGSDQDARDNTNYVSVRMLGDQMEFLKRFGYRVISLADYDAILSGEKRPRGREIVITFDDGHYTFADNALPVLERYRFPVTLFLISEFAKGNIKGGGMEEDVLKDVLRRPWVHIGGHTRTHPNLTQLSRAEVLAELSGSKADLESMFHVPVDYLAYPLGEFNAEVMDAARLAGYRLAFTTSPKKLKYIRQGPYALTRNKIARESANPLVFWAHVSGLYQFFKELRHDWKIKRGDRSF
jgi:peptidoglycan/xylan/chitin deacetylase (PgdA/CDA1 family)